MKAVIHRGSDYENALRTFQNKRMEYIEQEIRQFDSETLWLLWHNIQEQDCTLEALTGIAV